MFGVGREYYVKEIIRTRGLCLARELYSQHWRQKYTPNFVNLNQFELRKCCSLMDTVNCHFSTWSYGGIFGIVSNWQIMIKIVLFILVYSLKKSCFLKHYLLSN